RELVRHERRPVPAGRGRRRAARARLDRGRVRDHPLLEPARGPLMATTALEVQARPQDRVIRRPAKRRDWSKWGLGLYFCVFLAFLYGPMVVMAILSFQGYYGGVTFPFKG